LSAYKIDGNKAVTVISVGTVVYTKNNIDSINLNKLYWVKQESNLPSQIDYLSEVDRYKYIWNSLSS
jgi:hypothetical protein